MVVQVGGCEQRKQSLPHVISYYVLSIIILCIDLVMKSAKEASLQMQKESEDVQKAVEHSTKQLKKGLQDYSDQRFRTRNMHA